MSDFELQTPGCVAHPGLVGILSLQTCGGLGEAAGSRADRGVTLSSALHPADLAASSL